MEDGELIQMDINDRGRAAAEFSSEEEIQDNAETSEEEGEVDHGQTQTEQSARQQPSTSGYSRK